MKQLFLIALAVMAMAASCDKSEPQGEGTAAPAESAAPAENAAPAEDAAE